MLPNNFGTYFCSKIVHQHLSLITQSGHTARQHKLFFFQVQHLTYLPTLFVTILVRVTPF